MGVGKFFVPVALTGTPRLVICVFNDEVKAAGATLAIELWTLLTVTPDPEGIWILNVAVMAGEILKRLPEGPADSLLAHEPAFSS